MVETPRKRKAADSNDKKRRSKVPRALPLMSSVVEDDEDDEGLPPTTFLPRVVHTQQRISNSASSYNGVPQADTRTVDSGLQLPGSVTEQPSVYVVEEENPRRRAGGSDIVDLTTDTDIVDLTSSNNNNSVVIITSEQEFLNERPSCRYSGVQIIGEKRASVIHSKEPKKKAVIEKENASTKTGIDVTCPICLDKAEQFQSAGRTLVSTVCGHLFCEDCIKKTVQELHQCPTCRKKLTRKSYHPVYI